MRKSRAQHAATRSALTLFALPPLEKHLCPRDRYGDWEREKGKRLRHEGKKRRKEKEKKEVEQKKKEKYKIDYLFLEIVIHKFYNSYYYFYKILYYKIEYIL
jgi:hypothetical protein